MTTIQLAIADGDTLTVLDTSNQQHKIRLDGIDAPESHQDYGSRAKQSLSDLVFGKTVTVISSKKDRYGRTLGKVMLNNQNINLKQTARDGMVLPTICERAEAGRREGIRARRDRCQR